MTRAQVEQLRAARRRISELALMSVAGDFGGPWTPLDHSWTPLDHSPGRMAPPIWQLFALILSDRLETITDTRQLAKIVGVHSATLTSRFYRAGLPSLKQYIEAARMVRAAALLELPVSGAVVAIELDYFNAQNFSRAIRIRFGIPVSSWRRHHTGASMLRVFRESLVLPHLDKLRTFNPWEESVWTRRAS